MTTQNIKLPKFLDKLFNRALVTVEASQDSIKFFGIIMAINYPLYWVIWNKGIAINGNYADLILRLCATTLCLGLVVKNSWKLRFKRLFTIYWCITAIFCLPFFFTLMTLKYHASAVWLMNFMSSFFFLFLLFNAVMALTLLIIGAIAGFVAFYYFLPPFYLDLGSINLFDFCCTIFAAIIIGGLFSYNKEHIQKEKQKSLRMQAAAIAHEMRTPLAAVRHMATGLKMHLPTLIATQQTIQEKDESVPYINDAILEPLKLIPTELERVSRSAFTVIDTLLLNLHDVPQEIVLEKCSILNCVETALKAYSLTDEEKDLISLEIAENFELKTNSHLLKHVFFNLLKNSLHYVKAAGKGRIFIWTEKGEAFNRLHFKDTGKGISASILPNIFNQFYSRTDHGTGVGLAFCKMVLQKSGGDITCDSVEGEFTHFTLSFPVLTQ